MWPPGPVPGMHRHRHLVATIYVRSMRPSGKMLTLVNCLIRRHDVVSIGSESSFETKRPQRKNGIGTGH
jgi:hypothetical protein